MTSETPLSIAAREARRHDRERFTTALFAPPHRREPLMALYAFNAEIARVKDSVHEPMAGMIRLTWWREALAGERDPETARHPIAAPLLEACRAEKVTGAEFERLLDARERDLTWQRPASLAELEAYAEATSATVTRLAVELLGVRDAATRAAGGAVGTAYALVGLLRAMPFNDAAGRPVLPEGVSVQQIADRARALLAEARAMPYARKGIPALLPGTVASVHLKTLEKAGHDPFDPRVARPRPMPIRLAFNAVRGRF